MTSYFRGQLQILFFPSKHQLLHLSSNPRSSLFTAKGEFQHQPLVHLGNCFPVALQLLLWVSFLKIRLDKETQPFPTQKIPQGWILSADNLLQQLLCSFNQTGGSGLALSTPTTDKPLHPTQELSQ